MRFARTWLTTAALLAASLGTLGGCNKPSEESCRKALSNIRHLLGTEHLSQADQTVEGEVRRCRGGSKRESVECAINAKTLDELRTCKLIELPAPTEPATPTTPAPEPATPTTPAPEPAAAPPAAAAPAPVPPPAPAAPPATAPPAAAPVPAAPAPAAPAPR